MGGAWPEVRDLLQRHRRPLLIGGLLMLFNRAAGLVLPGTSKFLIDDVLGQGRTELLLPLAGVAALATVIQAATGFGLSQVVSVSGQRAIAELREEVHRHVIHLPVSYFDSTRTGVLISRVMRDAEGIRNLVGTGILNLVGGIVTAAAAAVILLTLNAGMTVVALTALVVFGGVMVLAFRKLRPLFRERGKIEAEVTGRLSEGLGGIRVVKTYVAEPWEGEIFHHGVNRLFRQVASTITATSAVSAFSVLIVGGLGALIMIMGGNAVSAGAMTVGDLVAFIFYAGLMASPLVQAIGVGTQMTEALAGLDRIRELRGVVREDAEEEAKAPIEGVRGEVAFEDVTFEYVPGQPVVRDVSFHAPPGTTTALVGPSGAGKSTLIGLVMGFHHPIAGTVRVDERDLTEVRLREYRRHLGVVLQDNFLFDGTLRENIVYGCRDATDVEIDRAVRVAHCEEFVSRFEDGLDTIIGERGVRLSGGQRQRVAIARAVLADPRILILDEATSSLDSETEALIRDAVRALRRGRTTFVIAHRLSTILSADQILVLEGGRVVERGTHDELLALEGLYRRLYDSQYSVEADRFINPGES